MSYQPGSSQSGKKRWQLALIFLIPVVAMGMAWLMYFTGLGVPDGRTNKGELILPPGQMAELKLLGGSTPVNIEVLEGRWGLLVFGSTSCMEQACQNSLYKTRQVHIALGKESERLVRLYVAQESPALSDGLNKEHPQVLWLNSSESNVLKGLGLDEWPKNRFFIIDPLGNIMMGYQPEQAGGDLLKDLKKLMKASNIG